MSPIPTPVTPSSGGQSPEEQFRVVRKRNRIPLSCTPCRSRKLKCDRAQPCSNCVRREGNNTSSCSYAAPHARNRKNQSQGAATSPDDMQNRIDRLEGLVLALMNGGAAGADAAASAAVAATATSSASSRGPADGTPTTTESVVSPARADREDENKNNMMDEDDSDVDGALVTSLGVLKVDAEKGKAIYVGHEHWHTILSEIAEVKNYFNNHKKELENGYEKVRQSKPASAREAPTLLLTAPPATEIELRAELPSKSSVLTLCERYFSSMDNGISVIHSPTFYAILQSHWQDPSKTPIMWLGMLYAILCRAMLSYHKVGDEPVEWKGRTSELAAEYRLRTVQCLVVADYTKPCEYTVETLLLYAFGEYTSRWDAELGLWLISSLITRIAFRMGYHRDAKWFPSITPFQAEMRRRVWSMVRMFDILSSLTISLPSMIQDHDCDTQLPNNILDTDFGPDSKVLPPSRPWTDPTPVSYIIAKAKLTQQLGNILQATSRLGRPVPYDEILRLDAQLREVIAELPPHLKLQSSDDFQDPALLIVARINLDVLAQKAFCMLHRQYLPRSRHNSRYAHSRHTAITAAMNTLQHLDTIHRATQGGRLQSLKWFLKSIATRDFLVPAMLIGLDLHYENQVGSPDGGEQGAHHDQHFWMPQRRAQMLRSLEMALEVWERLMETSMEAYKAAKVIRILLQKIRRPVDPSGRNGQQAGPAGVHKAFGPGLGSDDMKPEHSAAMTLGMLSGMTADAASSTPMESLQSPGGTSYPAPPPFPMETGFGGFENSAVPLGNAMASDLFMGGGSHNNVSSPLSSFLNSTNATELPAANFDWDAFETFTQSTTFGADSFRFIGANGSLGTGDESMFPLNGGTNASGDR